jgi:hypothetical protein
VWLQKAGRAQFATMWVMRIDPEYIAFYAGDVRITFVARRVGKDGITDDDGAAFAIYEYLGKYPS